MTLHFNVPNVFLTTQIILFHYTSYFLCRTACLSMFPSKTWIWHLSKAWRNFSSIIYKLSFGTLYFDKNITMLIEEPVFEYFISCNPFDNMMFSKISHFRLKTFVSVKLSQGTLKMFRNKKRVRKDNWNTLWFMIFWACLSISSKNFILRQIV